MSSEQRRGFLLDAAAVVIARDGLAQTSTRAITDEAKMRRGSFHYCFASKDELLQALIARHILDMTHAATETWSDERPLVDNLTIGLLAFIDVARSRPKEELLSYELAIYAMRSDTPEAAMAQYDGYIAQTTRYLEFVEDRADVEWPVARTTMARMLSTLIEGSLLHWLVDRDDEATEASVRGFAVLIAAAARSRD